MEVDNIYYIKLGEGGRWAKDIATDNKVRIGWADVDLTLIHAKDWNATRQICQASCRSIGAGTADANALERFCNSTPRDIWITFHDSKMWWGRLQEGPVLQDGISKYRLLEGRWSCHSASGERLELHRLPGTITKTQGYRATICTIREKEAVLRVLSGERSELGQLLANARSELYRATAEALTLLHWRDFELLVDLIFRQSGWRRVSHAGDTIKDVDLVLECPMTQRKYAVQVKASASLSVARDYQTIAREAGFERFYFAVHSPAKDLVDHAAEFDSDDGFDLLDASKLAVRVVDGGLTSWLIDHTP